MNYPIVHTAQNYLHFSIYCGIITQRPILLEEWKNEMSVLRLYRK